VRRSHPGEPVQSRAVPPRAERAGCSMPVAWWSAPAAVSRLAPTLGPRRFPSSRRDRDSPPASGSRTSSTRASSSRQPRFREWYSSGQSQGGASFQVSESNVLADVDIYLLRILRLGRDHGVDDSCRWCPDARGRCATGNSAGAVGRSAAAPVHRARSTSRRKSCSRTSHAAHSTRSRPRG
jgi:hypothetical protein